MAFKLETTKHTSKVCEGVSYKIHHKTYGRRIKLDKKIAAFNVDMRSLTESRAVTFEEGRMKALKNLGNDTVKQSESVISISATTEGIKATEAGNVEDSPLYKIELMKALDFAKLTEIDDKLATARMEKLWPMYMEVYLHSVTGLEDEEGNKVEYRENMSESDRTEFYLNAPKELIDEITVALAADIEMSDGEKANFGLPITGGSPEDGLTTDTTVKTAEPVDTTKTETAA